MLIYPSAFDINTGPIYWELFQRARAADDQVYVTSISTARNVKSSYVAYGHTMVVDPWGKVIKEASEKEEIVVADIGKI